MQVAKLQNDVMEATEINKTSSEKKNAGTRDTKFFLKNLKDLSNSLSPPKLMVKYGKLASSINEKVYFLNGFSQAVYSPKKTRHCRKFPTWELNRYKLQCNRKRNVSDSDRIRRHKIDVPKLVSTRLQPKYC